ncbi:MAG: alcohol dehydrogenase, partial [Propionibacteriaceae bacterium]|nr:alcohol dehydrogenase [Propionibacteriaceae bacterium]
GRFGLILSTVAASGADFNAYVDCLRPGGALVNLGMPSGDTPVYLKGLAQRKSITGTLIAGRAEHQAMLDFCGAHDIQATIELIGAEDITAAYDRVIASKVRYRYVIDADTFGDR